jgi:hypothetical protein
MGNFIFWKMIRRTQFVAWFVVLSCTGIRADETLPHWLDIAWRRGPDLPQPFQDSDGGIVDRLLVTTCGYSESTDTVPGTKKNSAPNGQHKKTWGLNLNNPANGWQVLPDYPGDARQELCGAVVGSQLFTWGGFSYAPPFAFRDGYRLSRTDGHWQWDAIASLPWPRCSFSFSSIV